MPHQPGGVLLQPMTRIALKQFYDDQLNLAIVAATRRPSPVFVTRLMNDSSNGSPTTHAIFYSFYTHILPLPLRDRQYSFRQRAHDFELPDRTSELKNKNFLIRM